jgi:hypothetical protein
MLVGESAHFRLFLDPALDPGVLAYDQSHDELGALETDFADKRTMLKTPDGQKIDYHVMTPEDVSSACGLGSLGANDPESGCAVNDQRAIAAAYLPHQHELIHAYMRLVLPDALPIPFLVEGMAQAIGCGTGIGTSLTEPPSSWEEVTMQEATDPSGDVYIQGGLFARYLIRTQGIDAYLRYYAQAPAQRDPAIFAANFSAFWNMSIDDVWTAMHTVAPGAATKDGQICPCSLAMLPTDGQLITNDTLSQPYWSLPDTYGASIALTAPSTDAVIVDDCEGVAPEMAAMDLGAPAGSATYDDGVVAVVEVPDAHPRYAHAPISRASVGQYLVDDCATGDPYPVPADFLSFSGNAWALINQPTTASFTKYLQLDLPAATQLVSVGQSSGGVCETCAFTIDMPGTCDPASTPNTPNSFTAGPVNARFVFPQLAAGTAAPAPATGLLQFYN